MLRLKILWRLMLKEVGGFFPVSIPFASQCHPSLSIRRPRWLRALMFLPQVSLTRRFWTPQTPLTAVAKPLRPMSASWETPRPPITFKAGRLVSTTCSPP